MVLGCTAANPSPTLDMVQATQLAYSSMSLGLHCQPSTHPGAVIGSIHFPSALFVASFAEGLGSYQAWKETVTIRQNIRLVRRLGIFQKEGDVQATAETVTDELLYVLFSVVSLLIA